MAQTKFESNSSPQIEKAKLSFVQSVFSGSLAGVVEVLVNHPLWTIKTRIQKGEPMTLNPRILYRGILPNAASMTPITATQVGLNSLIQQCFFGKQYEPTTSQRLAIAFSAGVGSALVSGPTEMIMTHQKSSFYAASQELVKQGGWSRLYTGILATMLREGMFTTFFLGVTPLLKNKITHHYPYDLPASIIAGIIAGVGATIASQGADTVKTIQQAAKVSESTDFIPTVKKLYSSNGIGGFFKGAIPRGSRVISAVTLMGVVGQEMERFFNKPQEEGVGSSYTKT